VLRLVSNAHDGSPKHWTGRGRWSEMTSVVYLVPLATHGALLDRRWYHMRSKSKGSGESGNSHCGDRQPSGVSASRPECGLSVKSVESLKDSSWTGLPRMKGTGPPDGMQGNVGQS
jgi:hypothetical protein